MKLFKITRENIWRHKSKTECRHWLHWGDTTWRYEGYLGKRANHSMLGVTLGGDENDVTVRIGIKNLFAIYAGVEDFLPSNFMHKLFGYDGRNYEISAFEEYLCFDFHRDDYGFGQGWKGIHWMFNWKEFLFGKWQYEAEVLEKLETHVIMPEGNYPAVVTIKKASRGYKRARKEITNDYNIDLKIPIPVPGKGENSWDCDDDAIYSSNLSADSLEEALIKIAESAMKTRRKYASESWVPAAGWKVKE